MPARRPLRVCTPMLACCVLMSCATTQTTGSAAEDIRTIERQRLRSLVDVDLGTARRLHSEDFELITPTGARLTREEYFGALQSGRTDYVAWDAGEITVRLYGSAAVIRYRDNRFDVNSGGTVEHRGPRYHTNLYERRAGRWQIVWSQASGIIKP